MKKCIQCDNEIEQARLEALPDTEFCIQCARQIKIPRARERFIFSLNDEPLELENAFE